jgi:hypothetical protein
MAEMTGGCMCGAKRFRAEVTSDEASLCHCRMCQRASGNVSLAFANVPRAGVHWEGEPDIYHSSPIARRGHCATCGATLSFDYPNADTIDLTVAAFDDPGFFVPRKHYGAESMHRAWLDTSGLPEYRADQDAKLAERWKDQGGRPPD